MSRVSWAARLAMTCLLPAALSIVCLGQENPRSAPPSPFADRAATAIRVTGRVSVLKDNVPWVIGVGGAVYPRQTILTGEDGAAVFQLRDGSTFEVFPNSQFVFRANPTSFVDLIDLVLGQIRVHIEKLGGKDNPNKIRTPTAVISVRGTTYTVKIEDEGNTTWVYVEEGQVEVQHLLMPYSAPKQLGPGDEIRVYKNQPLAQKRIDREGVVRRMLNAASDAIWVIANTPRTGGGSRTPVPGGGSTGSSGGSSGDTGATPPPPPPPAPPTSGGH